MLAPALGHGAAVMMIKGTRDADVHGAWSLFGTTERTLRTFIAFAEREEAEYLSTALFLHWHAAFGRAHRHTWAGRLGMVRLFAQWLHGRDPHHEIPP